MRRAAALYIAGTFGLVFTAIGVWQAIVMGAPTLLLANGAATLGTTAVALLLYRRSGDGET